MLLDGIGQLEQGLLPFDGVVRFQLSNAVAAAWTAWSISSGVDLGERPVTLPVAGSTSSVNSVAVESTSFPFT